MSFVKKKDFIDKILFLLGMVLYTAIMFVLFYRQTLGSEAAYHSDMKAYILEMQGLNVTYSFPYPIFFKFGAFLHLFIKSPELCIALATTILNCLSPIFLKYYMDKEVKGTGVTKIATTVVVFSVFFMSMVYFPENYYLPGLEYKYVGVFTPNPFHNATYMATRPFSIVCFFIFIRILQEYETKINWKDNILFAIFLLLTTMTKPSFTFVLVPTAGLIMLYRMIRAKFKNFAPTIQLGICFIPTFCALIYQYFGVFAPDMEGEKGIGFGIATAWSLKSGNILSSVVMAMAFPILMLFFNYKKIKESGIYRFGWQIFFISFAEALFLYEKGFRLPDMNFSWGYMHGIFFVFVASLVLLLKNTVDKKQSKVALAVQWLAYGAHVVCGIWYFRGVFLGNLYY